MATRLDLLDLSHDPLYRDAVLLTLLDPRHPKVPRGDVCFENALWHLRGHGLVAWNEATGQPDAVLTGIGYDLARKLQARAR